MDPWGSAHTHARPAQAKRSSGGDTAPPGCAAPTGGTSQPGDRLVNGRCWSTALLQGALGEGPSPCVLCALDLQCSTTAAFEGESHPRDHWHLSSPSLTPSPAPQAGDTPNFHSSPCPGSTPQHPCRAWQRHRRWEEQEQGWNELQAAWRAAKGPLITLP